MEKIKSDFRLNELGIAPCPQELWNITPKHPMWKSRIKFEIDQLNRLLGNFKNAGGREWFNLMPSDNPKYNSMIWKGRVWVPNQPEIHFDICLLLTSDYPKVMPRWYIDQQVLNYCGKIYMKLNWKDPDTGQNFVMPSDDHVTMFAPEYHVLKGDLGIAHYVILQFFMWWAAQQNMIIREFERAKKK